MTHTHKYIHKNGSAELKIYFYPDHIDAEIQAFNKAGIDNKDWIRIIVEDD